MANLKHLAILSKGVKEWNKWIFDVRRKENRDIIPDLSGADLSGANLGGVNLCYANLTGADLSEANLQKARLICAICDRTNFASANLTGAFLNWGSFFETNFEGANLQEAFLRGSNLSRATLIGVNLTGANLGAPHEDPEGDLAILVFDVIDGTIEGENVARDAMRGKINLKGADLNCADLRGANLRGADLFVANLQGAANLTIEQLAQTKTLCEAQLDPGILEEIKRDYSHLLLKQAPKKIEDPFWDELIARWKKKNKKKVELFIVK